jgi:hypothetical protein
LDVEAACTVRDWITHLARDECKTIVLTTHHTAERIAVAARHAEPHHLSGASSPRTRCHTDAMSSCCNPRGCDRIFTDRFARWTAKHYRRRGLGKTARRIVELVVERGVAGATLLEVGGGVGDIQVELLKRGAVRATNLELSPAYEHEAQQLLADNGLTGRVERRIVDIAATPEQVEAADIVVLHRVVCCYPDYARLLAAVADRGRRQVVFSHPPRNVVSRAVLGTQNLFFRLRGLEFRVFAHPPQAMLAVLAEHGMHQDAVRRSPLWQVVVATR